MYIELHTISIGRRGWGDVEAHLVLVQPLDGMHALDQNHPQIANLMQQHNQLALKTVGGPCVCSVCVWCVCSVSVCGMVARSQRSQQGGLRSLRSLRSGRFVAINRYPRVAIVAITTTRG